MVREARLLWDNPGLDPDEAHRLRRLEDGTDPRKPRRRRTRKRVSSPKPPTESQSQAPEDRRRKSK